MYFINRYRKSMSFPKRMLEDLLYRISWIINYYKNGRRVKTALFYPNFPSKRSVIYKIFKRLNYNISNNPVKHFDIVIHWNTTTYRPPNALISELSLKRKVINSESLDISKSKVDKIFSQVSGYSSLVQSDAYRGLMVKKSEINASHDGIIIQGPVSSEKGFVYQKLINNLSTEGLVEDMRIPVVNENIPLIYVKYKTLSTRFGHFKRFHHKIRKVRVCKPCELLSDEETLILLQFCKSSGLDYGELDVLRDKDSNQIYAIDLNNTPTGPPFMDKNQVEYAMNILTECFRKEFLDD